MNFSSVKVKMSQKKCLALTLIIFIYASLVTKLLADFRHDSETSKVIDFIKNVQQRNLFSNFKREKDRNFSNPCFADIYKFLSSLLKQELWALKMLDASSKIPSGLLAGNINDLGMYDECLGIEENKNGTIIRGRHCLYTSELRISFSPAFRKMKPTLSVCVPSKCNSTDVTHLLELIIFKMTNISSIGIKSVKATCSEIYPPDWTPGGITAVSVIGLIISFLLGCTFLDLLKMKSNFQNNFLETLSKFSLLKSARQILNTKINPNSLPVLNGIRVLSISWVVMGHSYNARGRHWTIINKVEPLEWKNTWYSLYVTLAPFAVDSFFALGGFLLTYLFLKEMSKGEKFNLFKYYLHRYIRLTPAVGMLLVFQIFIIPHLGSGPIWQMKSNNSRICIESSWTILLYLQNFLKLNARCLAHLWYLAADMQLFWFSPVILYPLSKKPKIGLAILAACFVTSLASTATLVSVHKYKFDLVGGGRNMMRDVYLVPYTRAGPWLVGVFFGYITVTKEVRLNKMMATLGWIVTLISFVFCTLGFEVTQRKDYKYNVIWETIFSTIARSIWALGLSWIMFASSRGYGGPVAKFLSLPIFLPLAKLSYCIYLVHPLLQDVSVRSLKVGTYFSDFELFTNFLTDLILSSVIAFFFSLFFESPILILEKIISRKKNSERKEFSKEDNNRKTKSNYLTKL